MPATAANQPDSAKPAGDALPASREARAPFATEAPSSAEPAGIRTLIVDDQLLSRELLRRRLRGEPDIEIVGTAATGAEAVEAIRRLKPDLVFLDVQMPDLSGFEVVSQFDPSWRPAIIFITADEEFARRAFDVHAVDYLLKPCRHDRFRLALQRAREEIRRRHADEARWNLSEWLVRHVRSGLHATERLAIRSGGRILFLRVADIDWINAAGHRLVLHAGDQSHRFRGSLSELETRLPAGQFLRVNRSSIVNIERIAELRPAPHGEHTILLRNGTQLVVTRGYRHRLRPLGVSYARG